MNLMQNPNEEGLLEYLEDIIGSNLFIPQINCTKEELEKVAELVSSRKLRISKKVNSLIINNN